MRICLMALSGNVAGALTAGRGLIGPAQPPIGPLIQLSFTIRKMKNEAIAPTKTSPIPIIVPSLAVLASGRPYVCDKLGSVKSTIFPFFGCHTAMML